MGDSLRSESDGAKPTFRNYTLQLEASLAAVRADPGSDDARQHYAVMVISGFYENVPLHLYEHRELGPDEKARNLVMEFDPQPSSDMLVACIWDRWTKPNEPDLYSFAAITDDPLPEVAATGHQRTIITTQERYLSEWLSPSALSKEQLEQIRSDKEMPYYVHQIAA